MPKERLLLESDAPHLPVDASIRVNTPAYLGEVAEMVARVRQEPLAMVVGATRENALRLYALRP